MEEDNLINFVERTGYGYDVDDPVRLTFANDADYIMSFITPKDALDGVCSVNILWKDACFSKNFKGIVDRYVFETHIVTPTIDEIRTYALCFTGYPAINEEIERKRPRYNSMVGGDSNFKLPDGFVL